MTPATEAAEAAARLRRLDSESYEAVYGVEETFHGLRQRDEKVVLDWALPYLAAQQPDGEVEVDGVSLIAAERQRQVEVEGWTPEHDDQWRDNELAYAAYAYVLPDDDRPGCTDSQGKFTPSGWPWAQWWWKPSPENRVRELVKAGALIAAEIDRLQRLSPATAGGGDG